jgi:hypothetical protein
MAEFNAGTKVKYRGMVELAEVLSGPHKTTGTRERYLIRKADGNVSLVPDNDIERIVPRRDQVAGTLAMHIYGRAYMTLDSTRRIQLARAAVTVLDIADRTHGQV